MKRNATDGRQRLQLCHSPPAIVSVSNCEQSALYAIFEESRGRQSSSGSGSARASPSTKAFVAAGLAAKGSKSLSTTPVRDVLQRARSPVKHVTCAIKANSNIGAKSTLSPPKHVHNIPPTTSVIAPEARYATAAAMAAIAAGGSSGSIPLVSAANGSTEAQGIAISSLGSPLVGLTQLRLMPNLLTTATAAGLGNSPFGVLSTTNSTKDSQLGKRESPLASSKDAENNNDEPPAKCSKNE